MALESDLHELGYTYLGPSSLYGLSWYEMFHLVDASQIKMDERSGVRPGDLDKLDRMHQKLKQKAR